MTSTIDPVHTRRLVLQAWDKEKKMTARQLSRVWDYRDTGDSASLVGTGLSQVRTEVLERLSRKG